MSLFSKFKPSAQNTQNAQNTQPHPMQNNSADIANIAQGIRQESTPRRCWHCDHWQKKPGSCWWVGKCALHGHDVGIKTLCREVTPCA